MISPVAFSLKTRRVPVSFVTIAHSVRRSDARTLLVAPLIRPIVRFLKFGSTNRTGSNRRLASQKATVRYRPRSCPLRSSELYDWNWDICRLSAFSEAELGSRHWPYESRGAPLIAGCPSVSIGQTGAIKKSHPSPDRFCDLVVCLNLH